MTLLLRTATGILLYLVLCHFIAMLFEPMWAWAKENPDQASLSFSVATAIVGIFLFKFSTRVYSWLDANSRKVL